MKNTTSPGPERDLYADARLAHYCANNLHGALNLYKRVIAAYPTSEEAEFSRRQIRHILKAMVPTEDRLEAETKRALEYLKNRRPPDGAMDTTDPADAALPE